MVRYFSEDNNMRPHGILRREDWDFEAFAEKLLGGHGAESPEGDQILSRCHAYEYSRSTPGIVRAFRRDQKCARRMDGDVWRCSLVLPGVDHPSFESCFPYPDTDSYDVGWLSAEELPALDVINLVAPAGFPRRPFVKTPFADVTLPAWAPAVPLASPVSVASPHGGAWIDGAFEVARLQELAHLRIRWECSNESIMAAFKLWLDRARPVQTGSQRGKSQRRQLWADLKALGTWRLLRAFRGKIGAARKFCEIQAGKNHFVRDEDWTLNRRRAQIILDDFARREVCG